MATSIPIPNPVQRVPPGMLPQQQMFHQQQPVQMAQSQPTAQPTTQQQSSQQQAVDPDQKKLLDMMEAINLINSLRDDMNSILDNVGKANSANNYLSLLAGKTGSKTSNEPNIDQAKQPSQSTSIGTPSSVSNIYSQNQNQANIQNEPEQAISNDTNDKFYNLDTEEQEFFEKTDNKYLQDKVLGINKSIVELDKIVKDLQPVQIINLSEFNSILLEQSGDERLNIQSSKLINSYKYINKLQENLNLTTLTNYKKFSQSYAERKSSKYKTYSIKPIKKEDLEKVVSSILAYPDIKVVASQKTEHQFVLDIIMPQNFKFVFLLFDTNVEKFQVRPLDSRIIKIYANNKPSDEICFFDFEHKNKQIVFQRLEENCLFACQFFKTEFGGSYLSNILKWIKTFKDLFNAKCVRCEKHLLNGVPPTWRDLKTYEPYHDECRITS